MENLSEAYKLMQKNCGIKVGDTVKILRRAESKEMGWSAVWMDEMDDLVGELGVVSVLYDYGIDVTTNGDSWCFPFFILEKLKSAPPPDKKDEILNQFANTDLGWSGRAIIEGVKMILDYVDEKTNA